MAFCDETEYWITADDEPLWLHQCGPISPDLYPQQTPVVVCVSLQGSCKSPAVQQSKQGTYCQTRDDNNTDTEALRSPCTGGVHQWDQACDHCCSGH